MQSDGLVVSGVNIWLSITEFWVSAAVKRVCKFICLQTETTLKTKLWDCQEYQQSPLPTPNPFNNGSGPTLNSRLALTAITHDDPIMGVIESVPVGSSTPQKIYAPPLQAEARKTNTEYMCCYRPVTNAKSEVAHPVVIANQRKSFPFLFHKQLKVCLPITLTSQPMNFSTSTGHFHPLKFQIFQDRFSLGIILPSDINHCDTCHFKRLCAQMLLVY
jgi:hypothetical protein